MRGHFQMRFMRFFHNRPDFIDVQCRVQPIGVNLKQVGTEAYLFTRSPARFFGAADHLRAGGKIPQVWRNSKWVVLPDSSDGTSSHLHSRALHQALVDRVPERHIGVARTFILNIPHGSEPSVKRDWRVRRSLDRTE